MKLNLGGNSSEDGKTVQAALEQCARILSKIVEMPSAAEDFSNSVEKGVESMEQTISNSARLTQAQSETLDNWERGIDNWLRRISVDPSDF